MIPSNTAKMTYCVYAACKLLYDGIWSCLLDARDENIAILEESAAIQMCLLTETLIEAGESADIDSITIKLTEKLLQLQEKQLALILKNIQQGLVRL